jgi:hypothetical protein
VRDEGYVVRESSTVCARRRLRYFVVRDEDEDMIPVEFEIQALVEGFADVSKAEPRDGAFARAQTKLREILQRHGPSTCTSCYYHSPAMTRGHDLRQRHKSIADVSLKKAPQRETWPGTYELPCAEYDTGHALPRILYCRAFSQKPHFIFQSKRSG